jgi:hypothetical protein
MTRRKGFDVCVAPQVERHIRRLAQHGGAAADDARHLLAAQDRLALNGTRADGVKKLRALDLWEIRAGRYRLFFCLVPRSNLLAVGVVLAKTSRRIRMARLKRIELEVHQWRDELERER